MARRLQRAKLTSSTPMAHHRYESSEIRRNGGATRLWWACIEDRKRCHSMRNDARALRARGGREVPVVSASSSQQLSATRRDFA